MENNMKLKRAILKKAFTLWCVFYSIITLVSSTMQLIDGQATDTNIHILVRAFVCIIGVITIMMFEVVKTKSKVLNYIIQYVTPMGLVFLGVWISGFLIELHTDAYKDIFFNFTGIWIVVAIITSVQDK